MEHPDNYQQEIQQRETKDVVDKREIGVIEEANEAAQEVYDGTVATGDNGEIESGDYKIKLKKGEVLPMNANVSLKLVADTEFEVVGAGTPEMAAGELASIPALYGAIREDLSHDEKTTLPDGRKVKRTITYGVGGVKMVGEETVDGVDTTELAQAAGGDISDEATARRAETITSPPEQPKNILDTQIDAGNAKADATPDKPKADKAKSKK